MTEIGKIYGSRYELQEKVGSGGFSEVYKAKDTKTDQYVAIKIIDTSQRIKREGKIYQAISKAKLIGITPLLDRDKKNKEPEYFVFPYREKGDLSERIKQLN